MVRLALCLTLSCVLLACGSSGDGDRMPPPPPPPGADASPPPGVDGGGPPPGTDASPPPGGDAGGPPPPGDAGGSDAGGPTPSFPYCQLSCVTAADCDVGSSAFDADNYACVEGGCRYIGCNTDSECAGSFFDTDYVCRDLNGQPTCQLSCTTAADCGTASAAYDEDNYACEAGVCRYVGCNTDVECVATFMDDRYGCRAATPPDTGVPLPTASRNCVLTCATAADCDAGSSAFDADNYACEAGVCRYVGCNTDSECAGSFLDTDYVCR